MTVLQSLYDYWEGGELVKLQPLPYSMKDMEPHMGERLVQLLYETNHKDNVQNLKSLMKESAKLLGE